MSLRRVGLKKRVALTVTAVILLLLICFVQIAELLFVLADQITVYTPTYARASEVAMTEILHKDQLSDEDYNTLYLQTGLTKVGIDRELKNGEVGISRILAIQECFFTKYEAENRHVGMLMCSDYLAESDSSVAVSLEAGDIVITSTTHLSGWRLGHSAMATSAYSLIESTSYGQYSHPVSITPFTRRANMIVLAPKKEYISDAQKGEIATFAQNNLMGVPYGVTVGLFSPKNSINKSQCAHLIWYAYNHFGFDIDSNGGIFVSPKNFLNSKYLEVVQVFGFDPTELWK